MQLDNEDGAGDGDLTMQDANEGMNGIEEEEEENTERQMITEMQQIMFLTLDALQHAKLEDWRLKLEELWICRLCVDLVKVCI